MIRNNLDLKGKKVVPRIVDSDVFNSATEQQKVVVLICHSANWEVHNLVILNNTVSIPSVL